MADGDGSSRNFRSAYYGKLGFNGKEAKDILDQLMSSSSFDDEKLSNLCDRSDLDRPCIEAWKVILGVECGRKNPFDEFANVRRVRAEHFQSLKHHLEVLLRHNLVIERERLKKCSTTNKEQLQSQSPQKQQHQQQQQLTDPIAEDHQRHSQGNQNYCKNESQQENLSEVGNEFIDKVESLKLVDNGNTNQLINENGHNLVPGNNENDNDYTSSNDRAEQRSSFNMMKAGLTPENNILDEIESKPGEQITLMYLLEAGRLEASNIGEQLQSKYCRKLTGMASFFVNVSNDLQEAFFLFRNFTRKVEENEALKESKDNIIKA